MDALSSRGVTLVEALVAVAMLGVVAAALLPAFSTQCAANARAELRSGAVAAAAVRLEQLRGADLGLLPSSGSSAPEIVAVGTRAYTVTVSYCLLPAYCDDQSRHLFVEVWLDDRRIYDVETVYTQLR